MVMGETWEQRAESSGKARIWKVRSVGIYMYGKRQKSTEITRGHEVDQLPYLATVLGLLGREARKASTSVQTVTCPKSTLGP